MLKTYYSFTGAALFALAACNADTPPASPDDGPVAGDSGQAEGDPTATRPADRPQFVTVEGRIEEGVECPILRTPDGDVWSLSLGEADFGPGDYVRYRGERADASFCQQGQGTLIAERVSEIEPPARDRDPARAGSVKLTTDYVTGSWVAKGVDADCGDPDFSVRETRGGLILSANIEEHDDNALIVLGNYPRLDLDEPRDDLPIESRGPDGLAILRPATDAAYDPITIGSATITGDGVVFVKCADGAPSA